MGFHVRTVASHHDSRRAKRLDVEIGAMLRERGSTKFNVRIADLSITGFKCETSFTLTVGNRVWLSFPGLSGLEAEVAWRDRFESGCKFVSPLHPAIFDHIAALPGARTAKRSKAPADAMTSPTEAPPAE